MKAWHGHVGILVGMLLMMGCGAEESPVAKEQPYVHPPLAGVDMTKPLVSQDEETQMTGLVRIPFRQGDLWGFADSTGTLVIPARYKSVRGFYSGNLALVETEEGFGLVNKLGREVVAPLQKDKIMDLGCGMWAFREGDHYAVLTNAPKRIDRGRVVELRPGECAEGHLPAKLADGSWVFLDPEGEVLPGPAAQALMPLRHGVSPVQPKGTSDWVIVNAGGKPVGTERFTSLFPFEDGLGVGTQDNGIGKHKYGVVDTTGKVVIPFQYGRITGTFEGGYVAAAAYDPYELQSKGISNEANTWFIYNRQGTKVGEMHYDAWDNFSEGLIVVERGEKYGFADTTGAVVIPLQYDWACAFKHGLAWVGRNGRYGFIDHKGREVIPLKYGAVYDYQFMEDDGCEVRDLASGERFYINRQGKELRNENP